MVVRKKTKTKVKCLAKKGRKIQKKNLKKVTGGDVIPIDALNPASKKVF